MKLDLSDGARAGMADALEKTFIRHGIDPGVMDLRELSVFVLEAFCANASLSDWDRLEERRGV